jgi:hypothetical protein
MHDAKTAIDNGTEADIAYSAFLDSGGDEVAAVSFEKFLSDFRRKQRGRNDEFA